MSAAPTATPLPERWFRVTPDSTRLPRPRLLARSLIDVAALDERIRFYEELTGTDADLRMPIPDFGGLELAAVGNMLLIASTRPFTPIQRRTAYSVIVPSLSRQLEGLRPAGTTVLEPRETILPGSRARVRFADGAIAELVEHRPQLGEQPHSSPRTAPRSTGLRLLLRRAVSSSAFVSAVAQYEAVQDTVCDTRIRLDGPSPVELAIIGNLLIVGTDGPEFAHSADVRLALVASTPVASAHARPLVPGTGHCPDSSSTGLHHLVRLKDGLLAEVWDTSIGLPLTAEPIRRAEAGTS